MQKPISYQKSIPIFLDTTKPPHSAVAKKLLREILSHSIEPLHPDAIREFLKQRKTRKRVFLTQKDKDLIEFFNTASKSLQYAVFLEFNRKLQEVKS
jgi:DNA helicase TIP49 (TBP-interacting protein)